MTRSDGFADQRLCVVPRPLVAAALEAPVTRRLLVTDAGWFPRAAGHARHRPEGAGETIVLLCTAGSGWVEAGGQRHRVAPGHCAVLPAGEPHGYGADDDDPWSISWCHLRGSDLGDLERAVGASRARPVLALRAPERATALLDEIVTALERDQSPARLLAVAGMAWRLMTQLAVDRRLPERGTPLERAIEYLEQRVEATVSVPELARLVGVSPSHLGALFREATGGGVLAHHTALKMARARTLLDSTGMTVSEIAREVGFDDPFYFSRRFARAHGASPTDYRRQRKG